MKKIEAVIKPFKLNEVKEALSVYQLFKREYLQP
jgi:nitrogen regulatory protein PII